MANKGMLPEAKFSFLQQLYSDLNTPFNKYINQVTNLQEPDVNFLACISEFYSAILTSLTESYISNPLLFDILSALDNIFLPVAIKLLLNEWNDIGETIVPGIKSYIDLLKTKKNLLQHNKTVLEFLNNSSAGDSNRQNQALPLINFGDEASIMNQLLQAIIQKMRFDDDYDFDDLDEEEETDLGLFMRDLKTLYENIGNIYPKLILSDLTNKINRMNEMEGNDLELILRMIGQLGDAVPFVVDFSNKEITSGSASTAASKYDKETLDLKNEIGSNFLINLIENVINMDLIKGNFGNFAQKNLLLIVRF